MPLTKGVAGSSLPRLFFDAARRGATGVAPVLAAFRVRSWRRSDEQGERCRDQQQPALG